MHDLQGSTLNPYIMFDGNCSEAMNFYKEALNGELEITPYKGSPIEVPDSYKDKILHARLTFGNAVLMAADGIPGQKSKFGHSIHLSISTKDLAEAELYFNNLVEGGTITMPFDETFWGATFGMLTDKFGVNWMVSCELPKPE